MKKKQNQGTTQEPSLTDQLNEAIGIQVSNNPYNSYLTDQEIFDWIKKEEGVRLKPYPDGKDAKGNQLYSIGYGHQIKSNEKDLMNGINQSKANELLKNDIKNIRNELEKIIYVSLNKNQDLAITSFRYNIGPDAFRKSTFLKKLNSRDYTGASNEFQRWKFTDNGTKISPVLVARREREKRLFLTATNREEDRKKYILEREKKQRQLDDLEKKLGKDPFPTFRS
jgi:lysozyme